MVNKKAAIDYSQFYPVNYRKISKAPLYPLVATSAARTTSAAGPQIPRTLVRVSIPAGAAMNLFDFLEIRSPEGVSLAVRAPFLGTPGGGAGTTSMPCMMDFIRFVRQAGGTVEIAN